MTDANTLRNKGAGYRLATAMILEVFSCNVLADSLSQWSECWNWKDSNVVVRSIASEDAKTTEHLTTGQRYWTNDQRFGGDRSYVIYLNCRLP